MSQETSVPNNHGKVKQQLSEDSIRYFLETQKEEIKLRQQEMTLREQEAKYNYELARENVRLQAHYMSESPRQLHKSRILVLAFFLFLILIVSGVFVYCIQMGKEELAIRILENIITAVFSAGGGYAWGKRRTGNNEQASGDFVTEQ